jgi:hypothetical protein
VSTTISVHVASATATNTAVPIAISDIDVIAVSIAISFAADAHDCVKVSRCMDVLGIAGVVVAICLIAVPVSVLHLAISIPIAVGPDP